MNVTSFYPVICTDRIAESQAFYTDNFGFRPTFETDWYVSLALPGERPFELALLDPAHPTIPEAYRGVAARGMLLNVEVEDVDAEYDRLVVRGGLKPALDIRTEDFGQRHFIVPDPNGILVDVIQEIPPQGEYVEAFNVADVPGTP